MFFLKNYSLLYEFHFQRYDYLYIFDINVVEPLRQHALIRQSILMMPKKVYYICFWENWMGVGIDEIIWRWRRETIRLQIMMEVKEIEDYVDSIPIWDQIMDCSVSCIYYVVFWIICFIILIFFIK